MFSYVVKRLLVSLLTLFVIVTITFFLMHTVPGGPFVGEKPLSKVALENLNRKYGLDKPLIVQYGNYLNNAIKGDLGTSLTKIGQSVSGTIVRAFPVSFRLGIFSMFISTTIGVLFGIVAALRHGKFVDRAVMVAATLGIAVPSFVVATVSIIIFSVKLRLLPAYGFDSFAQYIMPGFALSFSSLSFMARLMRSSMLDVIHQDYIKTARAKGISRSIIIFKHALRNAIIPIVTYMGPLAAAILTGSFVVEKIFNIPGLGRYFVESITQRDYPTILGVTIFYGAFLIAMNFLVDLSYGIIDPRIKIQE
ncbi:ABC transporter permease [Brachyspira hyodysenteriae]|uniref:ABC transporter permease n=1 Tax=Brachyspira hyodysenteriae TaxID=159 RepID=UPI003A7F7430